MTSTPPLADAFAPLASIAQPVSFRAGSQLVHQGGRVRGATLIMTGQVEALVAMPGGGQLAVARIGAGGVIGEMALLDRGTASATAIAETNVDGLYYDRDDFRALLAQRNQGALALQQAITMSMVVKLRALNSKALAHAAPEDRVLAGEQPPVAVDPLSGVARARSVGFEHQHFLPMLPFFAEFDSEEIAESVAYARLVELERGHGIFTQGGPAAAAYLVVRGAAEIDALEGRRLRRVAIAPPGSLIGYMSLIDGAPHAASGKAREAAVLLEFPRAEFLRLYQGNSSAAMKFQGAIRRLLMLSMARTNIQLTRLISQARIRRHAHEELQAALYGQLCHL